MLADARPRRVGRVECVPATSRSVTRTSNSPAAAVESVRIDSVRARPFVPALAALLSAAVFLPTIRFGFLPFDDVFNMNINPFFRGDPSAEVSWVLTTRALGHWIPMTWLTYLIDYAAWGRHPGGYHATNVLFHALNVALCYAVARRLLGLATPTRPPAALTAGALAAALAFGIHPLRTESVAWVTERRDVVSGFFFFLTVLAYLKAAEAERPRRRRWLGLSLLAFTASLLAKEITMTLPLVLVLLDLYPLRRFRWPAAIVEKIPFGLVGAAGAAVSLQGMATGVGFTGLDRLGLVSRVVLFAYSVVFYPLQTVVPVDVSPLHELPFRVDPLAPRFLASLLAAVGLTGLAILARRRAPWFAAAWAYSVLTILPVSGLAHAATILVADRYSYLSTLSWAMVLGGGVATLLVAPLGRALVVAALAGVILLLAAWGVLTAAEVRAWRDAESLWSAAVAADPACAQCHAGLAIALAQAGRLEPAEREATTAVVLRPDRGDHHAVLAAVLEREGRLDEAARSWMAAGRIHPHYVADALRALGLALLAHGRFEAAVRELRTARPLQPMLPVTPDLVRALNGLAIEQARSGHLAEAARALEEALALMPGSPEVRDNLIAVREALHR